MRCSHEITTGLYSGWWAGKIRRYGGSEHIPLMKLKTKDAVVSSLSMVNVQKLKEFIIAKFLVDSLVKSKIQ